MAVESIGKPLDEPCKACRPEGCALYAKRPKECRDWYCIWARGKLPDDHRPDKLGIMFYQSETTEMTRELRRRFDVDVYIAREIIPGAFANNEFLFHVLVPRHLIIRYFPDGKRLYDGRSDVLQWVGEYFNADSKEK